MAKTLEKWKELSSGVHKFARAVSGTFEGKQTSEFLSEAAVANRKKWARLFYTFCFALILALIINGVGQKELPFLYSSLGEVAEDNVYSPITADIEPSESNNQQKETLAHRVPPIFDYDDKILYKWLERWKLTFRTVRTEFYGEHRKNLRNPVLLEQLSRRVNELSHQSLRPRDLLYLHENRFSIPSEKTFTKLAEFLTGRIIASTDLFPSHYSTGIIVRQLNEGLHESLVQDVSRIWSLDQAREVLNHVPSMLKDGSLYNPRVMVEIINSLLVPNLTYNDNLTQKRIAAFLSTAKQPVIHVRKGQLLIRKGDRLNEQHLELLQSLRDLTSPSSNAKRLLLSFLILYVFLSILFRVNMGRKGFDKLSLKDALFFLVLSAGTVACSKVGSVYLQILMANFNLSRVSDYLIPISTGGIILHLMMGRSASYTYAFLVSIVVGYMLEQNFLYALWSFTITCAAIQSIGTCRTRTDLFKCGAWSGGIGGILLLAFSLIQYLGYKHTDWTNVLASTTFAFFSGMAATVLTSMFIPFLESAFGYTTSLKLLELSNFHHPLLHTLMMKAPGTYHHSVIVGSLAEIAADRVNANGLLARVSAYYHDIGKMTKPLYFIENQSPGNNPHDHLQPSMSAKILFSHVKNGVRMGKDYNLGAKVIDIIEQHHGTTLASYFYNKAKEHEHGEMGHAEESHFRYPGPKPQTREAGIVMLADACEAATRSIAEPTPAKIQTMVHHIITKRFLEEQFAECELTFQDLQIIEHHFTRTLVSLYHHRIEYPGQKSTLAKGNSESATNHSAPHHPDGQGKKSTG